MTKLIIMVLALTSLLLAGDEKPKNGCILSQDGQFNIYYQDKKKQKTNFKNIIYTPIKKEGENFKSIFIGSTARFQKDEKIFLLEIKNIKANPRVKPNPRTGTMTVEVISETTKEIINMNYSYDKNIMKASGKSSLLKTEQVGFQTKIKALLCNI